jgi:hypothetical protein
MGKQSINEKAHYYVRNRLINNNLDFNNILPPKTITNRNQIYLFRKAVLAFKKIIESKVISVEIDQLLGIHLKAKVDIGRNIVIDDIHSILGKQLKKKRKGGWTSKTSSVLRKVTGKEILNYYA